VSVPVVRQNSYFFSLQRADQSPALICRRVGPKGETEVLVDPHPLSSDHTTSVGLLDVSPDGHRLAYNVRSGGTDEVEIRVLDVETKRDLPDRLLYGSLSFTGDGKAFYYARRNRETGTASSFTGWEPTSRGTSWSSVKAMAVTSGSMASSRTTAATCSSPSATAGAGARFTCSPVATPTPACRRSKHARWRRGSRGRLAPATRCCCVTTLRRATPAAGRGKKSSRTRRWSWRSFSGSWGWKGNGLRRQVSCRSPRTARRDPSYHSIPYFRRISRRVPG
jgi:hypothetical protein